MEWWPQPCNACVVALTPSVTVLGDSAFRKVVKVERDTSGRTNQMSILIRRERDSRVLFTHVHREKTEHIAGGSPL